MKLKNTYLLLGWMALAGCGSQSGVNSDPSSSLPPVGPTSPTDNVVVKSRAVFQIQSDSESAFTKAATGSPLDWILASAYAATSGTVPVVVVNSPSSSMTLDSSLFSVPQISNALLDFGYLGVSALSDNNLKICGDNGHTKCGTALIRMYTTGTAGAGLYNSTDGYGMPIQAGTTGSSLGTVGLNVDGALVVQSITLSPNKHTVSLTDFTPAPHYDVKSDFTNAGAGSYSTTLVLEYGLTL